MTTQQFFTKTFDFFNNPRTALIIIVLFFLGFFLTEGLTTGFGNNFLAFGPTNDENGNPTQFMGIKLSSWNLVGIAYALIFFTTVLATYYRNVVGLNIHSFVFNAAITYVPFSKFWTYLILLVDPLINIILYVILFYATATFQIQYIIPQFLASYITDLPFVLKWLKGKTFV
jgi:hypothetical protein